MNKSYIDKSQSMINLGRDMQTLKSNESFQYLLERLSKTTRQAKEDIIASTTWDEFLQKKGVYMGLIALSREIDTIISRGQTKERILKTQ
jgi:hypothetical protein